MVFFYSDTLRFPVPSEHRFPAAKYTMLRELLVAERVLDPEVLQLSPPAADADIKRAHTEQYMTQFEAGLLDPLAMRRIGFPWSEQLVRRTRATVGGAIQAAKEALQHGISGQLAGGTHHAHRDFGSGFCIYNDQAVAALTALQSGWTDRVAIIDLDVHQGDGTASILSSEPSAFVFSMHGEKNFPFRKCASDLDVALPDGTEDDNYLRILSDHLPAVFAFRPDLVLYQAGVDPLTDDKLGRLSLTHDGLKERDRMVMQACANAGVPVSIAIGGGYAEPIESTVMAYANTFRAAKAVFAL